MLTKTFEEVFEVTEKDTILHPKGFKKLIATLEHLKDNEFHDEIAAMHLELQGTADERGCHLKHKRMIADMMEQAKEQPLYYRHQFLRKGFVENWSEMKIQTLNSMMHYCDLRLKVLKK